MMWLNPRKADCTALYRILLLILRECWIAKHSCVLQDGALLTAAALQSLPSNNGEKILPVIVNCKDRLVIYEYLCSSIMFGSAPTISQEVNNTS